MSTDDFLSRASKTAAKQQEVTEADIEAHYCEYAKKKKCRALKLVYLNKKGFPDRTTLCPGARILFIEFKRKGKKLAPTQLVVKTLLQSFGFEYHVCDEIGQAEAILDEFLNEVETS